MKRWRLYREYRRQGLRRAWSISGMAGAAVSAGKAALLLSTLVGSLMVLTSQAEAIQDAADNRVAARLSSQAGEIAELRHLLAACLGDKDGVLWIGGEAHLCRAVPTGVRQ